MDPNRKMPTWREMNRDTSPEVEEKLLAYWRDILGVTQTQGDRLDLAYLQEWVGVLGVGDLLEWALADKR